MRRRKEVELKAVETHCLVTTHKRKRQRERERDKLKRERKRDLEGEGERERERDRVNLPIITITNLSRCLDILLLDSLAHSLDNIER